MFASFLAPLRSSYHGSTTRPDDIESGGGAATTHNQQNAFARRRVLELSAVSEMFASFLASLRSTFHGPTAPTTPPPQTAAAAAPQPVLVPLPLEISIESGGSTAPTTHNQHHALPSMESLAVPAAICVDVYTLIPPQDQLNLHRLRYSPLLASLFLAVVAASLSLLWQRTPHYHQRRRRSIEVAVASLVFSSLLRIILDDQLLPAGKPLIFVAGFFFLQIGLAAIYVLSPPRHPNSSPV